MKNPNKKAYSWRNIGSLILVPILVVYLFPRKPSGLMDSTTYLTVVVGAVLNGLVVAVNDLRMPVLITSPRVKNRITDSLSHTELTTKSRLTIFADIINIRGFGMASIGDFFILGGVLLYIVKGAIHGQIITMIGFFVAFLLASGLYRPPYRRWKLYTLRKKRAQRNTF